MRPNLTSQIWSDFGNILLIFSFFFLKKKNFRKFFFQNFFFFFFFLLKIPPPPSDSGGFGRSPLWGPYYECVIEKLRYSNYRNLYTGFVLFKHLKINLDIINLNTSCTFIISIFENIGSDGSKEVILSFVRKCQSNNFF